MDPADIDTFKWREFMARKVGTRQWTIGKKLTGRMKALGYQKAVPAEQVEQLREEFRARFS